MAARLEDQLGWSERAAGWTRLWYRGLLLAALVAAASLPAVTGVFRAEMVTLLQCHERWIGYRPAAETLKRKRHPSQARAGAYKGEDRDWLLAGRAKELLTRESASWAGSGQVPGASQ